MPERYEIRGKIARGGIGAIYRAYDTVMGREVAIKRLLPLEDFPMISFGLFHPAKPGPTVQRFIDETLRLDAELRAPAAGR